MHERTILVLREDERTRGEGERRWRRRGRGNKAEKDAGEKKSGRTKGIEGGFLFYPDTFLPFTPATPRRGAAQRGEAMPKIDLSRRIVPAENGYKLNEE